MKFFGKDKNSQILSEGLTYRYNNYANNLRIKELLIEEQFHFCAYTEKYLEGLDSVEVEHFDSSKKYFDDYYNYYAVLRKPNLFKKDESYKDSTFFQNRFFQNKEQLENRIRYLAGEYIYEEVESTDQEAKDFIDFLGLNNHDLYQTRIKHLKRLQYIFQMCGFSTDQIMEYFRSNLDELSFITLLENELDIDLSEFYTQKDI